MTMEHLMSLPSSGRVLASRSNGEPIAPRPAGVHQSAVMVVLDVNKSIDPAALFWALTNVVRKGDSVKVLGIITHVPNSMGFMVRVDQSIRNNPNIMELQFEIATKKEAIWRTKHIVEWSRRAGIKLEVDVKAGNNSKVIVADEAKSIGAYHVVLDKNMKKDRKYFVDNLPCFVSRFRNSGGVDTIRSYAVSNMLPPMTPKGAGPSQPGQCCSKGSSASSSSGRSGHRGASSMSSTSFELGGESSDEFSALEGDPLYAPSTGESLERPLGPELELKIRTASESTTTPAAPPAPRNLYQLLRGHSLESGNSYNMNVNPLKNSAVLSLPDSHQRQLTLRHGQRIHHLQMGSMNGWIGQLNVAPTMGRSKMGRQFLAASLETQASFNCGRKPPQKRPDKIRMDMQWPLMHWADCQRGSALQRYSTGVLLHLASHNSMQHNLRSAVRGSRVSVSSGLNYDDMIDSD